MSGIKFVYFDLRARGEPVRLVLAAAGKEFDDVRLSFDQWSAEKPNAPYGQLPYMEYKGKIYGQSIAMANFFSREFGLYGKSNLDALRVDEVVALGLDLQNAIYKAKFKNDESKKVTLADLFTYNVLDTIIAEKSDAASTFPPEVNKLRSQVEAQPNLKSYLANRKPAPF
nr:hypothetical protein BaRGS_012603 [Batillaria attramentaria]